MRPDLHIRQLNVTDAPAFRALRLRALREHPDAFTSSFEEATVRPLAEAEARLAPGASETVWGAFLGSALAGMVGLNRETRLKCRHKGTLVAMYVAPEFAGLGLGAALVNTVITAARADGLMLLVLTVTDSNDRARALYERAGFTAFGTEPDAIRVDGTSFGKTHMYLQLPAAAIQRRATPPTETP